ncbi:MAG: response regulator transcription factor [Tsuneonella suprasediminis]|uniref:Response regulator n=1 Tax=Tsuneonella suprasediminis TaxID=2306996 RepID=A0A419R4M9_9SPHN|nr:response regulator [Tsuneonella suprasediminis]RJX69907.1 response regulator [Tsuneonella suprasediminis]UBS31813.1 response regulator [Altererythrobacter sp. N1]
MPKILVADDDEMLCELVRFKLEGVGHEVEIVADGVAAINAVRSNRPDILILDNMMPVMSGPEVLHELKADPATADVPVIVLTARKAQEDVVTALRSGAADYLTKPFMPDELVARISGVLATSSNGGRNAGSR